MIEEYIKQRHEKSVESLNRMRVAKVRKQRKAQDRMEHLIEVLNIPFQVYGHFGCTGGVEGYRIGIKTGWRSGDTLIETYSREDGWAVIPPKEAYYDEGETTKRCSREFCFRIEQAQWAIANSFHPRLLDRVMKDPDYFAK